MTKWDNAFVYQHMRFRAHSSCASLCQLQWNLPTSFTQEWLRTWSFLKQYSVTIPIYGNIL